MAAVAAAKLTATIFAYVFVNLVLLDRARSFARQVRVAVTSVRR